MIKTKDFLDSLRVRYRLHSDADIARLLHVSRSAVSAWRHRKAFFDDSTALRVSALLDVRPGYVLACSHAEREHERPEIAAAWLDTARALERLR